ncbi:hypothetical protein VN1279_14520 [Helicobacter pylori]|nr:hypothetical protein VN1279_14520 [Helicobacter pylori]
MKKVLIINGAKAFGHSGGKLNETLSDHAKKTLESLGLEVDATIVDKGYNHSQEVEKSLVLMRRFGKCLAGGWESLGL